MKLIHSKKWNRVVKRGKKSCPGAFIKKGDIRVAGGEGTGERERHKRFGASTKRG